MISMAQVLSKIQIIFLVEKLKLKQSSEKLRLKLKKTPQNPPIPFEQMMVEECKNKPGYLVKEEREGANKNSIGWRKNSCIWRCGGSMVSLDHDEN